jgi:hypothetical protein
VTLRRAVALLAALLTAQAGCVSYDPQPLEAVPFRERSVSEHRGDLRVSAAALGQREGALLFGVPLANQGIQPVWLEIQNGHEDPYLFLQQSVDPDYFSPREAAYKSHYSPTRRIFGFGLASLFFLPLLLVAPFQYFAARSANGRMDALFEERAIGNRIVEPGETASGFLYAQIDEGTKKVPLALMGVGGVERFELFAQVPGARLDHHELEPEDLYAPEEIRDLDWRALYEALVALPCCTTNRRGDRNGDPLNLIVIGDFDELLPAFTRARWDETELIDVTSSLKTIRSFFFGSTYRYSPMSDLFLWQRSQDVAFQRARETIHERNHLRLWLSPLRLEGREVWVGQVSRDIGVRFTTRTWNLTTHAIDPDIDDSRENLMGDLLGTQRVARMTYLPGVEASTREEPARNLMGDPYHTDGRRAVVVLSDSPVAAQAFRWRAGEAVPLERETSP